MPTLRRASRKATPTPSSSSVPTRSRSRQTTSGRQSTPITVSKKRAAPAPSPVAQGRRRTRHRNADDVAVGPVSTRTLSKPRGATGAVTTTPQQAPRGRSARQDLKSGFCVSSRTRIKSKQIQSTASTNVNSEQRRRGRPSLRSQQRNDSALPPQHAARQSILRKNTSFPVNDRVRLYVPAAPESHDDYEPQPVPTNAIGAIEPWHNRLEDHSADTEFSEEEGPIRRRRTMEEPEMGRQVPLALLQAQYPRLNGLVGPSADDGGRINFEQTEMSTWTVDQVVIWASRFLKEATVAILRNYNLNGRWLEMFDVDGVYEMIKQNYLNSFEQSEYDKIVHRIRIHRNQF